MNRHYTAADFLESCGNLRAVVRHPAVTTDIICGFPGVAEEEFEETLGLVRRAGFYEAHVFRYSRRRGTAADRMDGQIPEKVKAERSRRLIALAKEQSERFRRYYLGRQCAFLSEELVTIGGAAYETGYTREYVRCLRKTQKLHRNDVIYGEADRIYGEKGMDECLVLR
jgi:threonylcarbamoyladenosine tRNA methylthiotransferase MtaB